MRFEHLRAKGIGPFRAEIDVDLTAIPGPVIAVVGENGAGKSTFLELLTGGALYRECPTRGPLASLATERNAFLEVDVVNGASHRIRHVVDAVSGKGESVVTDDAGRPLTASGKLKEFDTWATKHLPSPEVLFSSSVSPQGSGGFLAMKPAERKSTLLRALGIERLEGMAKRARERASATKTQIGTLDARIADEQTRASDPAAVQAEIAALDVRSTEQRQARGELQEACDAAVEASRGRDALERALVEYRRRAADLTTRLTGVEQRRADVQRRLENNRGVLKDRERIATAQERARALDGELERLQTLAAEGAAAERAALAERNAARDALADNTARWTRATERVGKLASRLVDRDAVRDAQARVAGLRQVVDVAELDVSGIERDIRELQELQLHGAARRIEHLRLPLATIAAGTSDPKLIATTAIAEDDAAAERAAAAPAVLKDEERRLSEARAALATARRDLATTEKLAARSGEIAAAEAEISDARAEQTRLGDENAVLRERFDEVEETVASVSAARSATATTLEQARAERGGLDPTLKLAERLMQAEARIAELEPQLAAIEQDHVALGKEMVDLGPEPVLPASLDLAEARSKIEGIDDTLRGLESALAVRRAQLVDAQASAERLGTMRAERAALDLELSDWTRLGEDLGRDGIQALEIDAAGPELTTIANTLLHEAFGPRFTVRFDTTRLSADRKKEIEDFAVSVIDTVQGRDANAETLSGGERVILGEAISLALSTLACRLNGVERPTLVRDESGAALDEGRARSYVAMLRRAAELVGADRVLLVSHSPAVWDLCDARLEIAGGKVRVAA